MTQAVPPGDKNTFQRRGRCQLQRLETVWRTFHIDGGQWVDKAPQRPTPTHLQAARANDHERGARDRDAPLALHDRSVLALTKPTYLRKHS